MIKQGDRAQANYRKSETLPIQSKIEVASVKISIIIPVYNEEGNIAPIYKRVTNVMSKLTYDYEIIFVDDGSSDTTEEKINYLAFQDTHVKVISLARNFGHQFALIAGYNHCSGDAAVTMDGDLQHPPELIPDLVKKWEQGFEIVHTIRNDDHEESLFKKYTSKYFYEVFSKVSGIPMQAGSADFRLVDRRVVEQLNQLKEYEIFLRGMFHWLGARATYISYSPNKRFSGATKYNLKKMLHFAFNGLTSFSIIPLRLVTMFGFLLSGITFIYMIYTMYSALILKTVIGGWTSMILSILFLGGIQLISIGMLGEYIGKIFLETKKRPRYVIKSKKGW